MKRLLLVASCVLSVAALAAFVTAITYGMFLSETPSAPSSFGAASLSAPGSPAASGSGAPITVTWTASTIDGTIAAENYTVERFSGSGTDLGAACGGSAVTGLTCQDSPTGDGTFKYEITANYKGWSTVSGFTNTVTINLDAPLSVSLENGRGQGNAYIDSVNAASVNIDVGLDANSKASDTVTLTASDGTHTLTFTASGTAGAGTAHFDNLDLSSLDDGTITFTATVTGSGGGTSTGTTATFTKDTVAPVTSIVLSPAAPNGANGWYDGSDPTFTLSADDGGGSGVAATSFAIDAGSTQSYPGAAVTIPDGATQTVSYFSTDKAGNVEATNTTAPLEIDTVAPTNSISLVAQSPAGSSFKDGDTIYYRGTGGGSGGSFELQNAVSDALSGPAASSTAALGGTATGWTHTPGTTSTPAGGPFDSGAFTWSEGTSSSPTEVVTGADIAGNTTAAPALTFVNDSTPPAGAVLAVNGQNASASGTTGYSSSTSFDIGTRTDFTDSGSGLASSVLTVQSFALSSSDGVAGGTCAGAPSGPFATATTIPATTEPTGFVTGYCYTYTLTGTDKVGNTATISTTVKVDTTGPSAPAVTLSGATGNTFVSGSTVYIDPQTGDSGSFAVSTTSTDPDSGIQKIGFPALTGFASGGGDVTSPPFQTTYSWSGAGATASGSQTVTATDNAGLTNTGGFTVAPDTTAPSGGSVNANGLAGTNSLYSSSLSVSLTLAKGTDAGSGLAPLGTTLFRAQGTLSSDGQADGTCSNFGSFIQIAADPAAAYTDAVPADDACYEYEYLVPDHVGNIATYTSGVVKVETAAPASLAPTFTFSAISGTVSVSGTTVSFQQNSSAGGSFTVTASASDDFSGVTGYTFPAAPAGWNVTGSGASRTYSYGANAGAGVPSGGTQSVTARDNATLTSSASFALTPATLAVPGALTTVHRESGANDGAVVLTWHETDGNGGTIPPDYEIQRAAAGSSPTFAAIATVAVGAADNATTANCNGTTCTWTDTSAAFDSQYEYEVLSFASSTWTAGPDAPYAALSLTPTSGTDETQSSGSETLYGVSASADMGPVLAVGSSGTIYVCVDAMGSTCDKGNHANLQLQAQPVTTTLYAVAYQSATDAWAVGAGGVILHCTAGCGSASATWNQVQSGLTTSDLHGIYYNGTVGWIVGDGGTILSYSAGSWSAVAGVGTTHDLMGVTALADNSVTAVGAGATIIRCASSCTTGSNWVAQTAPSGSGNLESITPDGNGTIAVGDGPSIIAQTAETGAWAKETASPSSNALYGVSFGGPDAVAVGANGQAMFCNSNCTATNATWNAVSGLGTNQLQAVDRTNGMAFVVGQNNTAFVVDNGGASRGDGGTATATTYTLTSSDLANLQTISAGTPSPYVTGSLPASLPSASTCTASGDLDLGFTPALAGAPVSFAHAIVDYKLSSASSPAARLLVSTDGGSTWSATTYSLGTPSASYQAVNVNLTGLVGQVAPNGAGQLQLCLQLAGSGSPEASIQQAHLDLDAAPASVPAITSADNATFTVGTSGTTFQVTASGSPAPTSYAETGTLPSGVTFDTSTGLFSGTPATGTGGKYDLTLTATNPIGTSAPQAFTLNVDEAPKITSANSTSFVFGAAGSFTVTTSGFPTGTMSFSDTAFGTCTPASLSGTGITFTNNGDGTETIQSTTSTPSGSYTICLNASNGVGAAAMQSFTLTVSPLSIQGITFASPSKATDCHTNNFAGTMTSDVDTFPNAICSSDGNANPGTFSWNVELANGTPGTPSPVTNTSGSPITVTVTKVTTFGMQGGNPPTGPAVGATATIASGASVTGTAFSVGNIGGGDAVQVTVSVTLGGNSYTLELQVH